MKKSIIFGLFMVLSTFLTTSLCTAIQPEKIDFPVVKTEKTINVSPDLLVPNTILPGQYFEYVDGNWLVKLKAVSLNLEDDSKVSTDDHKQKDYALPSEGIELIHPKSIHYTKHSRYLDRLEIFNRQISSNKLFFISSFNKVRLV